MCVGSTDKRAVYGGLGRHPAQNWRRLARSGKKRRRIVHWPRGANGAASPPSPLTIADTDRKPRFSLYGAQNASRQQLPRLGPLALALARASDAAAAAQWRWEGAEQRSTLAHSLDIAMDGRRAEQRRLALPLSSANHAPQSLNCSLPLGDAAAQSIGGRVTRGGPFRDGFSLLLFSADAACVVQGGGSDSDPSARQPIGRSIVSLSVCGGGQRLVRLRKARLRLSCSTNFSTAGTAAVGTRGARFCAGWKARWRPPVSPDTAALRDYRAQRLLLKAARTCLPSLLLFAIS